VIITPEEAERIVLQLTKNAGMDVSDGIPRELLTNQKVMDAIYSYFKKIEAKRKQQDGKS
jgi:hypothetical protein